MSKEVIGMLTELLTAVLLIVVPFATKIGLGYVKQMAKSCEKQTQNDTIVLLVDEISKSIQTAVEATNQTYVDAIKNSDNPFTKESQEEAFKKAYQTAFSLLSYDAKLYIAQTFDSIENYLTARIEAEVQKQKLEKEKASTGKIQEGVVLESCISEVNEK